MGESITSEKIAASRGVTTEARALAERSIASGRENEAQEIFTMVDAYLSDSRHFEEKKDLINAFGCLYYAHGWLDAGARLKIFDVSDTRLFTV